LYEGGNIQQLRVNRIKNIPSLTVPMLLMCCMIT
jgi:hypothetical protein